MRPRAAQQPHPARVDVANPRDDLDKLKISAACGTHGADHAGWGSFLAPPNPAMMPENRASSFSGKRSNTMKTNRAALLGGAALGLAGLIAAGGYALNAATSGPSVAIDADDIGGVVLNPGGQPEAGVWVIAETKDLDVRYIKIVV